MPAFFKYVLKMNLKEYIQRAVRIFGVSAGFFGRACVSDKMLPVLREPALTSTFTEVSFGQRTVLFDAAECAQSSA